MDGVAELKTSYETLMRLFTEYQKANDEKIKQLEARSTGAVDPLLQQKIDKTSDGLTEIQTKVEELIANSDGSLAVAETETEDWVEFHKKREIHLKSGLKLQPGEPFPEIKTDVTKESYAEYDKMIYDYLRFGEHVQNADTLRTGQDGAGGYWINEKMSGKMIKLILETSEVRQYATVESMARDSSGNAIIGHAQLNEVETGWVGEGEPRRRTKAPDLARFRMPLDGLYAMPRSTQEMLDFAAFDVEGWLVKSAARGLALRENNAFVNGNGVAKPKGFLTYPEGLPTAENWARIEVGNTGAAATLPDGGEGIAALIRLQGLLKKEYLANARWFFNRRVMTKIRELRDADGRPLWQPDIVGGKVGMLLGHGTAMFEDMPNFAANSKSIVFGDMKQAYLIGDRPGIRVMRDAVTEKGWVLFYTYQYVGGQVVNFEAIKIMKTAA